MSKKEASLMDPLQRLFLEAAWSTLEDAGYGGSKLKGSNTGVYIGLSNTNGIDYIDLVEKYAKDEKDIATPGNLKSITASRINYLLDLKGPSMLIDTACSSSLTAIHVACQALKSGDCDYALVGGVKINVIPGVKQEKSDLNIIAEDGYTRSFDNDASGTGLGEGVAAILLKPVKKAVEDHDHIYAVIKGSAVNQDGNSLGITAPNSKAQEEVIIKAWESANIDPQTISYIEAHGTATKLGDPVEIKGITNAFKRYTDKKQFCAIASLKSNIGHLDAAAGIAGVIKAALAVKEGLIPATVNFNEPNSMINFINSPIYINDQLSKWEESESPRRCGISSFGLSGTNAHVLIEDADSLKKHRSTTFDDFKLLTLSALSEQGIRKLLTDYHQLLTNGNNVSADDLCYTANTGRGMYSHRLAIIFKSIEQLAEIIPKLIHSDNFGSSFYSVINVVKSEKDKTSQHDLTTLEQKTLTKQAEKLIATRLESVNESDEGLIEQLAELYVKGAQVNWDLFYSGNTYQKISLPVYPFSKNPCWIEMDESKEEMNKLHPLIDKCLVESLDTDIYTTTLNIDHWEIGEHMVKDKYLLVGTAYVEMAASLARKYCNTVEIQLTNLVCESPLFVEKTQNKDIQFAINKQSDGIEFAILGRNEHLHRFDVYSRGSFKPLLKTRPKLNEAIRSIITRCDQIQVKPESYLYGNIRTSERWMNLQELYIGDTEAVGKIQLKETYKENKRNYILYPALLDSALNAANSITGDGIFLPWYYKRINIYSSLPDSFTSYIKLKKVIDEKEKVLTFDILLIDHHGEIVVEVEDYAVKQVDIKSKYFHSNGGNKLHELKWKPEAVEAKTGSLDRETFMLFRQDDEITDRLVIELKSKGAKVIQIKQGEQYERLDGELYCIANTAESYEKLLEELSVFQPAHIIHSFSISDINHNELSQYDHNMDSSINSMFFLVKEVMKRKEYANTRISVLSNHVNEIKEERFINSFGAALFGMSKSIYKEYTKMNLRCVDTDEFTSASKLIDEMYREDKNVVAAFRRDQRYIQKLETIKPGNNANSVTDPGCGAVLITGGAGGIGFELAKYLGSKGYKNIALMGRSQRISNDILHQLNEMKLKGVNIEYYSADVTDHSQLEHLIVHLRASYGRISGVIHSAGIAGSGLLFTKDKADFDRVVKPKIYGTLLMDELLKEDHLEFFITCSSLTAEFSSAGQVDYAAGNAFLDAFTYQLNKRGVPALTIDWCGWNESGMALKYGINEIENAFKTINNAEAIEVFQQVFLKGLKRVLIMERNKSMAQQNTQMAMNYKDNKKDLNLLSNLKEKKEKSYRSPGQNLVLTGKIEGDITDRERVVGYLWYETLGETEINVKSKFFEIGGDSILATYLLRKINHKWKDVMDITDIFNYSSISEMAGFIDNKINPVEKKADDYKGTLNKLASGEISIEEALLNIK
jgi:polyketide synthase PksN